MFSMKKRGGLVFLIMALVLAILPYHNVKASVTSISWSGTNLTGSSIDTSTELGDAGDSTINFTTGTNLTSDGDTIKFVLKGAVVSAGQTLDASDLTLSGASLEASPGTADNGIYEVSIVNGSAGDTDPEITIILDSNSGTAPNYTSGAHTLTIADGQLESSATPGNYSIIVMTSAEVGIGMLYVGDDNDVIVTATVVPNLSLLIRNSSDTADTNTCDLGELSTSAVSTCEYRVAVSTNASSGFQVQINSDGDLRTGAGDTIDAIAEDSTVSAGSEGYGIEVTGATAGGYNSGTGAFDQAITEDGDFNDDDTPIPTSASNFLSYSSAFQYTQGTTTTSTLVTHKASIDAATMAGSYQQIVTYTVTATF